MISPVLYTQEDKPVVESCAWPSPSCSFLLNFPAGHSAARCAVLEGAQLWGGDVSLVSFKQGAGTQTGTLQESVREAHHKEAIAQTLPAGAEQPMSIRERSDASA